jgi:hypothetical protein
MYIPKDHGILWVIFYRGIISMYTLICMGIMVSCGLNVMGVTNFMNAPICIGIMDIGDYMLWRPLPL